MSHVGRLAPRSVAAVVLLGALVAVSGCVGTSSWVAPGNGAPARATLASGSTPAQRTSGGRTTKVGLPLTRAQKIGLWTGVAVVLGYLMADDAEESAPVDGP